MIEMNNVCFAYEPDDVRYILNNITLSIAEGEFVAFLGPNGSGKSTLARLLNALLLPSKGRITINGLDTAVPEHQWNIRKNVQMVFQNPENQIVGTTLEEDIAFGLSNIGYPQVRMEERIRWALEQAGLEKRQSESVHTLSGGEKQKLAIAGALALSPKYIILDEATSMLDEASRRSVMYAIRRVKGTSGVGVILITHHLEEVLEANRVVLFDQGKLVAIREPLSLISDVELLERCGIEIPFLPSLSRTLNQSGVQAPVWPNVRELVNALWK